jgi:hypothetical protein
MVVEPPKLIKGGLFKEKKENLEGIKPLIMGGILEASNL